MKCNESRNILKLHIIWFKQFSISNIAIFLMCNRFQLFSLSIYRNVSGIIFNGSINVEINACTIKNYDSAVVHCLDTFHLALVIVSVVHHYKKNFPY